MNDDVHFIEQKTVGLIVKTCTQRKADISKLKFHSDIFTIISDGL